MDVQWGCLWSGAASTVRQHLDITHGQLRLTHLWPSPSVPTVLQGHDGIEPHECSVQHGVQRAQPAVNSLLLARH